MSQTTDTKLWATDENGNVLESLPEIAVKFTSILNKHGINLHPSKHDDKYAYNCRVGLDNDILDCELGLKEHKNISGTYHISYDNSCWLYWNPI
jgi:hypothetical protein